MFHGRCVELEATVVDLACFKTTLLHRSHQQLLSHPTAAVIVCAHVDEATVDEAKMVGAAGVKIGAGKSLSSSHIPSPCEVTAVTVPPGPSP